MTNVERAVLLLGYTLHNNSPSILNAAKVAFAPLHRRIETYCIFRHTRQKPYVTINRLHKASSAENKHGWVWKRHRR